MNQIADRTQLPQYAGEDSLSVRLSPQDPSFYRNPWPAYAALHARSPVFFWEDYGFWCIASHDGVNAVLRDRRLGRENRRGPPLHDDGSDRRHLAAFDAVERHSMLEREPPVHTRLRTLVNKAFVSRQVERYRPMIRDLALDLAGQLNPGDDLIARFATPIPIRVIAALLGVPSDMEARFLDWSHRMVAMYTHRRSRSDEISANEAAAEFSAFIRDLVAQRRHTPGDDLLSILIAARDHGEKLSDDELVTTVILLLNAGHEATVHQTGNAVAAMLESGKRPSDVAGTPAGAAACADEALRFCAPLHLFTRHVYEPVDIGPVTLDPGDTVGLMLAAANRDPAAFSEPDRFLPERSDQKTLAFGAGIHFCIGAPLARIELAESLGALFAVHPDLKLARPPLIRNAYHFHGLEQLIMG